MDFQEQEWGRAESRPHGHSVLVSRICSERHEKGFDKVKERMNTI